MSAHRDCYGTMLSDFIRREKNKPLGIRAFSALVVSHGIGVQSRTLEVRRDGWEKCVACPGDRTCHDVRLELNLAAWSVLRMPETGHRPTKVRML